MGLDIILDFDIVISWYTVFGKLLSKCKIYYVISFLDFFIIILIIHIYFSWLFQEFMHHV